MAGTLKPFVLVAKPGIVFGNLISVAGGFFLASRGQVDAGLLLSTLTGVALVIASGCVWNNYVDRKLDRQMARTQNRVLAQGLLSPRSAVSYASVLGLAGVVVLWAATNRLCVVLALAGLAIYVGVYSLYLKRKSIHGTLVGSLAGAVPPLIGYCAVRGRFDLGAILLLAIFSLWQMPHSYSIALYRLNDYTAAALPVLPVQRGIPAAKKQIVGYILAFMVATLMLTFGGYTGYGYFAVALAMGFAWLYLAWSGYSAPDTRQWAKKQFVFSIISLVLLCIMMSVDFTTPPDPGHGTTNHANNAKEIGR